MVDTGVALGIASGATLLGVVVGQWLPELFARSRVPRALYEAAITAVCEFHAVRGGETKIDPNEFPVLSGEELEEFRKDLTRDGVRRHIATAGAARAALAALHPYSSDLKPQWDQFAVPDDELDELISKLRKRSKRPRKRYP
jgi:hypothetical protein